LTPDGGGTADSSADGPTTGEGGGKGKDGGTSTDGGKSTDGGQSTDGGKNSEGGASTDSPTDTSSGIQYYGLFSVSVASGITDTYTASTSYGPIAEYVAPGTCPASGTKVGSCCFVAPAKAADAGTPPTPPDAGNITLTDGGSTLAMMDPALGIYTAVTNPPTTALTWGPGDKLGVSATGHQVDAYTGMLATGALFTGVTTSGGTGTSTTFSDVMSINVTSDFVVNWAEDTIETGDDVTLVLTGSHGGTSDGTITCYVPDSAKTVSVDKTLLSNFSTAGETATASRSNGIVGNRSVAERVAGAPGTPREGSLRNLARPCHLAPGAGQRARSVRRRATARHVDASPVGCAKGACRRALGLARGFGIHAVRNTIRFERASQLIGARAFLRHAARRA
jgi:hypothetical protein